MCFITTDIVEKEAWLMPQKLKVEELTGTIMVSRKGQNFSPLK